MEEYLKQFGLSETEEAVYLACARLGETSLLPISRQLKLPTTSAYQILERLAEKKLITIQQGTGRRKYLPAPPQQLLHLLTSKRAALDDTIDSLKSDLPRLNSQFIVSASQPQVRIFKGEEIRLIAQEILEQPINEICFIGGEHSLVEVLGKKYLKKWTAERVAKQIKSRTISTSLESDNPMLAPSKQDRRSVRYLPLKSELSTMIYGHNVVTNIATQENIGMVVTSREHAATVQEWFDVMWKVAGETK